MRESMIDLHIVVLLITIAHCNLYINKVLFWLFLGCPLCFNMGNQWHLYFLSRFKYRITWHVLQADMPANVSDMCPKHFVACPWNSVYMCGAELDLCMYIQQYVWGGKVACRSPEPEMAHRMGCHLVLYDRFFQPI